MPQFNVHDRVRLSERGRATYVDYCGDVCGNPYGNPHDDVGTIVHVNDRTDYLYWVEWDCGVENQYQEVDLELVEYKPQRKKKGFAQWVKDLEVL